MARIVEVIWTAERRGRGTEESLVRLVTQLWTKDGKFICEYDPAPEAEEQFQTVEPSGLHSLERL